MNKKIRFSLLTLLVMLCSSVFADPYTVDFNTAISTSAKDFAVASNWGHVSGYDAAYDSNMSYSYNESAGVEKTGCLLAYRQYKYDWGQSSAGQDVYDLLITPQVKGTVSVAVKQYMGSNSYIEFYAMTDNGDGTFTRGDKIDYTLGTDETLSQSAYCTASINVADYTRIGIRASYMYLDNFTATEANIIPEKALTIASADPTATTGTIYWDQQANGKVLVKYTVTVKNTGDIELTQGMEGYSVSIFNRDDNTVYVTTAVPQDLAVGATSDPFVVQAEVDASVWPNSYAYHSMDLRENLKNTVLQRAQSHYNTYQSKFIFRVAETTSTSSISTAETWGTITESTTKNFEIFNNGLAPLTIKSITLPTGFTCDNAPVIPSEGLVLNGKASIPLNITQDAATTGTYTGNLSIEYLSYGAEENTTYTLAFSATVIGANTWVADFNNTKSGIVYPAGSIVEYGIYYDNDYNSSTGTYNYWITGRTQSSYASGNNMFITPKLHAAAGDKLAYDVKGAYNTSYYAKVYVSTDRKNWNQVAYYTQNEKEGAEAIGYTNWYTKDITFDTEGNYYVAFSLYGTFKIDNLVGLEKVDVAHDLYIKSVTWPDASIKSGSSQSKPSLDIIPLTDETAEAYTVKYVCGDTTLAVGTPVALTASANSSKTFTFNWTPQVEKTTKFEGTKVVFDFGNNVTFETDSFNLTVTNEPIFHFVNDIPSSKWNEPTDRSADIAFGKTNKADKKSFYIYNWGSAPLTVKNITVPAGFTATPAGQFVVAAFDENDLSAAAQAVEITFSATEAGVYSDSMVVTYLNGAGEEKTFKLLVSGTKLDPTKWYANFDDGGWPAGSVYQSDISSSNGGTYSVPNYYITSSSTTNNIFVTPKLTAAAGEKLMFDAKLYSSYWSEGKVVVYAAATREEVLNAEEGTTRDTLFSVSGQDAENAMTTDFQTFEVTVPTAGDYFFGFEISNRPYVDEIYGLKPAAVAHDWTIASSNVPAEAMQNVAATATVNILNLGLADEAADSYTATLFVNNEAVATADAVTIPMSHKLGDAGTQLSFNFRYPKAGTFPVYIEVKAGDYSVKTAPVDVAFTEEIAVADAIEVGSGSTTSYSFAPIDFYNFEQARTSDILYTSAQLTAFGLKSGDKITSLAFKGTLTSAKTLANSSLKAWVALSTGEITYNSPDKSAMTEIAIYNAGDMVFVSGTNMVTINLPEAITYDGTSDLRIYLEGGGNSEFVSLNFAYDSNYQNMKWSNATSMKYNPLLYVNLAAVEPVTISGTVKNAESAAIEGATVTLISNDGDNVQYTGSTDAEGAYSINVIQNARDYKVIAAATGYEKNLSLVSFANGSAVKDIVLSNPYLANPSFELAAESTASTVISLEGQESYYGWTLPNLGTQFRNITIGDATTCTGQALGVPTAKDGSFYYYARRGWNSSTSADATLSTTMNNLPVGRYTLTLDYKGMDVWEDAHKDTGSYLKLVAIAGETELNSVQTEAFGTVKKDASGQSSMFTGEANWKQASIEFDVETAGNVTLNIVHHLVGGTRTDVVIDNLIIDQTLSAEELAIAKVAEAVKALNAEIAAAEALKTEARTEGIRELNAAIEIAKALQNSTDVPAINAGIETLKAAETAFLTANLPVAEGTYYVFNPLTQKFLSRGNAYGTAAMVDDYGVAINVTYTDLNAPKYTLKGFDNNAPYGFDAWMYSDATGGNVRTYYINKVEGGITLTNTNNNQFVYVYLKDDANKFQVAGNAIKGDNYTDDAQTVWQLMTKDERDIFVARHEATQKAAAFAAASIAEDAKLEVAEPTLVSFTSGNAWTQTVVRTQDNQPATNANGTEMWQATGNYKQVIKNVPSGLYKVSIQAFYRNGGADECVARYNTGYNTVLAYLEANGNKVQVKSWATDKGNEKDPNDMDHAKAKFDEGKYLSEVYTFVGEDSILNLTVNNPTHIGNGRFIVGNVQYAKVDEAIIAGDANLDGTVTTSDAVAAVNFALEKEVPSEKAFKAADVNSSNSITVSDAVGIVNIALGVPGQEPTARGIEMTEAVNFLTMNGNALELMNTTEFVGFQMDVTLANGAMLNGVSLADRAAGLQVAYNRIADNTYRIIAFSAGNAAIEGNEGALFSLDITGNANVNITNIEFADAAAHAYALGFGEATGIKGIYAGATNMESYTVGGVKNDKVRKGMNVVRATDGKVKKVFVK